MTIINQETMRKKSMSGEGLGDAKSCSRSREEAGVAERR